MAIQVIPQQQSSFEKNVNPYLQMAMQYMLQQKGEKRKEETRKTERTEDVAYRQSQFDYAKQQDTVKISKDAWNEAQEAVTEFLSNDPQEQIDPLTGKTYTPEAITAFTNTLKEDTFNNYAASIGRPDITFATAQAQETPKAITPPEPKAKPFLPPSQLGTQATTGQKLGEFPGRVARGAPAIGKEIAGRAGTIGKGIAGGMADIGAGAYTGITGQPTGIPSQLINQGLFNPQTAMQGYQGMGLRTPAEVAKTAFNPMTAIQEIQRSGGIKSPWIIQNAIDLIRRYSGK